MNLNKRTKLQLTNEGNQLSQVFFTYINIFSDTLLPKLQEQLLILNLKLFFLENVKRRDKNKKIDQQMASLTYIDGLAL